MMFGEDVPRIGAIDPRIGAIESCDGPIDPKIIESRAMGKYKVTPLKKGWSRQAKILVGCGSGCGLVFIGLFVVILCVLFSLTRPGETFPCETFIDPAFDNVALLRIYPDDPGAKWALKRYIRVTLERGMPPVPPVVDRVLEDLAVQGRMRNIAWYLPAEIAYGWSFPEKSPVPEKKPGKKDGKERAGTEEKEIPGEETWIISSSRSAFGLILGITRRLGGFSSWKGEDCEGESIFYKKDVEAVAFLGRTVIRSNRLDSVKRVLRSVKARSPKDPFGNAPRDILDLIPGKWDLAGVSHNRKGNLSRIARLIDPGGIDEDKKIFTFDVTPMKTIVWEIDLPGPGQISAHFHLFFGCAEEAAKWLGALDRTGMVDRIGRRGLAISRFDFSQRGRRITLILEGMDNSDLTGRLMRWLNERGLPPKKTLDELLDNIEVMLENLQEKIDRKVKEKDLLKKKEKDLLDRREKAKSRNKALKEKLREPKKQE